jgi:hypothetical protein
MNTRTTPFEEISYISMCLVEVIRILGINAYKKIRPVKK